MKAEIKKATLNDVGADIEDRYDRFKLDTAGHDSAKKTLLVQAQRTTQLMTLVDKDVDEGAVKEAIDKGELGVADYVKSYIKRAVDGLVAEAKHQENLQMTMQGGALALAQAVELIEKKIKVIESQVAVDNDDGSEEIRTIGERPTISEARKRKLEERSTSTKKTKKKTSKKQASNAHAG